MRISVPSLLIFSTLGSFLVLTNANLQVENEKAKKAVFEILDGAFEEARERLLAEAVVRESNFKDFLNKGQTVDDFINDETYGVFKKRLYYYYIDCSFFDKYSSLTTSVDLFTKTFIKDHQTDVGLVKYTAKFKEFLSKDEKKYGKDLELTNKIDVNPEELKITIEEALTAKITLAVPDKTIDEKYYEKLFKAIKDKKFEDSFGRFTLWRYRVLDDRAKIDELVNKLYESFDNLDVTIDLNDDDDEEGEGDDDDDDDDDDDESIDMEVDPQPNIPSSTQQANRKN